LLTTEQKKEQEKAENAGEGTTAPAPKKKRVTAAQLRVQRGACLVSSPHLDCG
jgi:hypothetical protein